LIYRTVLYIWDMTVKELIKELKKLDPELQVFVRGYEGGVDDVGIREPSNFVLNYNTEDYYGSHEEIDEDDLKKKYYQKYTIVKGVQL